MRKGPRDHLIWGGGGHPEGTLSCCAWAQDAAGTKMGQENRLVSGLVDHRYPSVAKEGTQRDASAQATHMQSDGSHAANSHITGNRDPLCDIPSGCCSFTGPWTVTRSSLRMLRRVAAFCCPPVAAPAPPPRPPPGAELLKGART